MSGRIEKAEAAEELGNTGRCSPAAAVAPLPVTDMDVVEVRRLLVQLYEHLMRQVITLIVAVSICMLSVSVLTRVLQDSHNRSLQLDYFAENTEAETVVLMSSFGNAFSFLGMIVIVNCVLVFLYKGGHYNIIKAWMITGTAVLLFLTGFYYVGRLAFYFNAPLDYVTCSLVIWNVGATGITALHREGPFLMQQGYLVYISVLMAVTLEESFPEWTSWILLVLVSAWDIFAVLCVVGPLRILLETAKERDEPLLPALVFSTSSAWCYAIRRSSASLTHVRSSCEAIAAWNHSFADKGLPRSDVEYCRPACSGELISKRTDRVSETASSMRSRLESSAESSAGVSASASVSREEEDTVVSHDSKWLHFGESNEESDTPCSTGKERECPNEFKAKTATGSTTIRGSTPNRSAADSAVPDERDELDEVQRPHREDAGGAVDRSLQRALLPAMASDTGSRWCSRHGRVHHRHRASRRQAERELRDAMSGDQGMKMGLGDFIFYSVLVGKASRHGTALTVIACYVAIIVGILFTLALLVHLQKPLPALPVSIGLGIAAYFSSSFLAEPFIYDMDAIIF